MFFGHINVDEPSDEMNGHFFKHSRGIHCFEYRAYGNVIITGHAVRKTEARCMAEKIHFFVLRDTFIRDSAWIFVRN